MTSFRTPLLTPAEVAKALRITRQTVYALIYKGEIDALRIGGQYRIPKTELERMLSHSHEESA